MHRRLIHLYQRKRIININLNVMAAGFLAIACTKGVIWAVDLFLPREQKLLFTVIAPVADVIFDVLIYYVLHWCANHWRPLSRPGDPTPRRLSFLRDATLIQFERALLSPIYYILAGALMHILQDLGWHPGWAMAAAFTTGLMTTRVLHTALGLYTGSFRDPRPGEGPIAVTASTPAGSPASPADSARSEPDDPQGRGAGPGTGDGGAAAPESARAG